MTPMPTPVAPSKRCCMTLGQRSLKRLCPASPIKPSVATIGSSISTRSAATTAASASSPASTIALTERGRCSARRPHLMRNPASTMLQINTASAPTCIRQHTSAYVSVRQHTSVYASIRQHTSAYASIRQHTSAYVSIRQHTSAVPAPPARLQRARTWQGPFARRGTHRSTGRTAY